MSFIRRVGGERFIVWADGVRLPGYATSDEKAIDKALEALQADPDIEELAYSHEKETILSIPALRAFAKALSGVDNTNEGGPAPFPDVDITTTSLSNATVGVPYSQQLAATGGDGGYTWSRVAGTWPTGITMSSGGLISGTPTSQGVANVTVRADDELGNPNSTDDQALTLTVNTASAADWVWDWDQANTAAMISAITSAGGENSSTGAGGIELLTGLTGTPWGGSKALRCQFLASGSGTDHQIGATLSMSTWADTNQPREIWLQSWVRWSSNWSWTGPYAGGGAGHKHLFLFDDEQTGAGRWENIVGIGNSTNQMTFAGGYASENGGTGGAATAPAAGLYSWAGAGWLEIWYHGLMNDPNGVWEMAVDGELFDFGTGGDLDRGAARYFKYIALSRNQNNGKANDESVDWAPIYVYTTEPAGSPF